MFLYSTYSVEKIKCKHQEFFLKLCLSENKTLKTDVEYQALFLKWFLWEIQFKTNAKWQNCFKLVVLNFLFVGAVFLAEFAYIVIQVN